MNGQEAQDIAKIYRNSFNRMTQLENDRRKNKLYELVIDEMIPDVWATLITPDIVEDAFIGGDVYLLGQALKVGKWWQESDSHTAPPAIMGYNFIRALSSDTNMAVDTLFGKAGYLADKATRESVLSHAMIQHNFERIKLLFRLTNAYEHPQIYLFYAVARPSPNGINIIRLLVAEGQQLNQHNRFGDTVAMNAHYSYIPYLLELPDIDWNARNSDGFTALLLRIHEDKDITPLLTPMALKRIDLDIVSQGGMTAFSIVC